VTAKSRDRTSFEARLLVAADGSRSPARTKAEISTRLWSYPQVALTVLLAHEKPHRATSVEFHTRSGPCTLVPLAQQGDTLHRSSLVWLMSRRDAERRQALPADLLAAEIEHQVHSMFGRMRLDRPPGFFPMKGMRVNRLVGTRLALIGEAAHVFPPLAAQGLNLSLRDIASLVEVLERADRIGADIGGQRTLARYQEARQGDISLRTSGVDLLNRSLLSNFWPVDFLRSMGFVAFSKIGFLRRAVIREGVLPYAPLPRHLHEAISGQRTKRFFGSRPPSAR
jgi:2-octaprenyl-6-methoxyphenol hydroxylase